MDLVKDGNWTAEKMKNILMFSELKESNDAMFMQQLEANVAEA